MPENKRSTWFNKHEFIRLIDSFNQEHTNKTTMNTFTIPEGTKELKVNFETKTVEFLPEEDKFNFNKGDILIDKYGCIIIFSHVGGIGEKDLVYFMAYLSPINNLYTKPDSGVGHTYDREWSYTTEQQKQLLFDALAKEGLKWNAETKQIEKLRWRAEKSGCYYYIDGSGIAHLTIDGRFRFDDGNYNYGNYFQTQQQAEEAFKKVKELLLGL